MIELTELAYESIGLILEEKDEPKIFILQVVLPRMTSS